VAVAVDVDPPARVRVTAEVALVARKLTVLRTPDTGVVNWRTR